jgi:hypothetical protein
MMTGMMKLDASKRKGLGGNDVARTRVYFAANATVATK